MKVHYDDHFDSVSEYIFSEHDTCYIIASYCYMCSKMVQVAVINYILPFMHDMAYK
jgi:hypothetical protein